MAEEEKITAEANAGVVKEESRKPKATRRARRKPKAKRTVKREVKREAAREPRKSKDDIMGVSKDTLLSVLLALAILASFYFFFQANNLRGEVDSLKRLIGSPGTTGSTGTTLTTIPYSGERVKLDFYVMSKCPYGVQVLIAVAPVLKQLGSSVDFSANYIADDNGDETFSSLHGDTEVQGDIAGLCAKKYAPTKYMDVVECMSKDVGNIPANWQSCAQQAGVDVQSIKTCYEGAEGKNLLSASIVKTNSVGATGSPTIYLNGQSYNGGRATNDFLRAICSAFNTKPDVCKNLPAPVKVNVVALSDTRCGADCDLTNLISQLKSLFPGLTVQQLDYSSTEGKSVYDNANLTALPALLFKDDVQKGEGYANVQRYLEPAGQYMSLRIGAAWDPYCDATAEHCSEAKCNGRMSCRPEVPKKLDVFVMSQCPYGIQALDAMKEILQVFKGQMNFSVNYIASETSPGVFDSLHGAGEVAEDIRELCAIKYYSQDYKFMDYILCRNKNIQSTAWESCATDNGMDAAKIKTCSEGAEGKQLLSENIKAADQLNIGGSPTFLVNNKKTFNAINAAGIQSGFCGSNTGLSGCSATVATPAGASATAAGSGGSCG